LNLASRALRPAASQGINEGVHHCSTVETIRYPENRDLFRFVQGQGARLVANKRDRLRSNLIPQYARFGIRNEAVDLVEGRESFFEETKLMLPCKLAGYRLIETRHRNTAACHRSFQTAHHPADIQRFFA